MKKIIIISLVAVVAALIVLGIAWWHSERVKDEVARQNHERFEAQYNREQAVKAKLDEVNKSVDRHFKK